jgi:hypothetical protein
MDEREVVPSLRAIVAQAELAQRHEQQGRIEDVAAVMLHEARRPGFQPRSVSGCNAVPDGHPADEVCGQAALAGDPNGAFDCDPTHEAGVRIVLASGACLPYPLVRLARVVHQPLEVAREFHPARPDLLEHERRRVPSPERNARPDVAVIDDLERAASGEAERQVGRAEECAVRRELEVVACARVVEARRDLDHEARLAAHGEYAADQPVATLPVAGVRRGIKSCTSPTPSGMRKRVMRTLVSGR